MYKRQIWGDDFNNALINSKMALNLSRGKPTKYYSSNRIASIVGNGLLTFIDKRVQLSDFFNDNPVEEKKSEPGLFSKDSSKGINLSDILSGKDNETGSINVNAYLWRASLDILSIAPLISTDALGGTIISDWYVNKDIKNQRLKITAFIIGSELRSDGIRIKVHIQNFKNNNWSETSTLSLIHI